MTDKRIKNDDGCYATASEIRHVVKVYFLQTSYFGLAHTMLVCIADDFLDDCATAGCDRRLLALSLPLRRLTDVLRRSYPRFFFSLRKPADSSSICCTLLRVGIHWQPRTCM